MFSCVSTAHPLGPISLSSTAISPSFTCGRARLQAERIGATEFSANDIAADGVDITASKSLIRR